MSRVIEPKVEVEVTELYCYYHKKMEPADTFRSNFGFNCVEVPRRMNSTCDTWMPNNATLRKEKRGPFGGTDEPGSLVRGRNYGAGSTP